MATTNNRTLEQVRIELEAEREQLASAVDSLRSEVKEATDVGAKLRRNLPVYAAAALGAGFLLAGGLGASKRRLFGRGEKEKERARLDLLLSLLNRD
jgi:hypothetical protein